MKSSNKADPDKKSQLSGVFHRDDTVKHVHTQMINWHGPTGTVFSVDVQPHKENSSKQRVATGGADSTVQVWELKKDSEGIGCVDHLSELNRHDCAVNVVRFHPTDDVIASASDDRCLFIWRLDTSDMSDAPRIFSDDNVDEKVENKENWTVIKQLRGHGSEVYDIAWSPDAKYITSGTMDNTTYVWDTNTCRKVAMWQHHKSYVQGVAWDPMNKLVTTVSSDRSAMVYSTKKFDLIQRISKIKSNRPMTHRPVHEENKSGSSVESVTPRKPEKNKDFLRIFLDTGMVDTFFRRPGFSPDGNLVGYPCGCYELENDNPHTPTPGVTTSTESDDKMIQINVVYIYQTKDMESPVMCLPTGNSPAIAVRFCPQLFELRGNTTSNSTQLFSLPYRMIYAVVTLDNVLLYDTQQKAPFACIGSIHYEQLTDASWSSDGQYLLVSSIDGFCSIVTFDTEKLGVIYRPCTDSLNIPQDIKPGQTTQTVNNHLNTKPMSEEKNIAECSNAALTVSQCEIPARSGYHEMETD